MAGDRAVGTFLSTPLDAGVDENKLAFCHPVSISLSVVAARFFLDGEYFLGEGIGFIWLFCLSFLVECFVRLTAVNSPPAGCMFTYAIDRCRKKSV